MFLVLGICAVKFLSNLQDFLITENESSRVVADLPLLIFSVGGYKDKTPNSAEQVHSNVMLVQIESFSIFHSLFLRCSPKKIQIQI